MKKSSIHFDITLDDNKLPEKIEWNAQDSGLDDTQESKSLMIAVWDKREQSTMRIDLWTKEMLVDEMKVFYHQCLLSMADTFERATNESKLAGDMRDFAAYFKDKMNLENPANDAPKV